MQNISSHVLSMSFGCFNFYSFQLLMEKIQAESDYRLKFAIAFYQFIISHLIRYLFSLHEYIYTAVFDWPQAETRLPVGSANYAGRMCT